MTVLTELSRASFVWTGVETAFACGFPADKTADLQVFFVDDDGVQSGLTLGVHFTASLANTTKLATVLPLALPPAPGTLVVQRRTPALVTETLADGQEFSLRVLQQMFDRLAMSGGEFRTLLSRAIVLAEGAELGEGNFDLGGSGLANLAPGQVPTDAATVGQVQAMQVADGNVPSPLLGDVNKLLVATGVDTFGWQAFALAYIAAGLFTADPTGRGKFATGFVDTGLLADGVLTADVAGLLKMADGFLSATPAGRLKMADGFLSANTAGRLKMADKFVTLAKMDDMATARLLGRNTAGSGPPEQLSPAIIRAMLGVRAIERRTAVPTTSGSNFDFLSLPTGAQKATLMLAGVGTNGATNVQVQLGTAAGFVTAGYLGATSQTIQGGTTQAATPSGSGFPITAAMASVSVLHGSVTLHLLDELTNTWVIGGGKGYSNVAATTEIDGSVVLPGPLTQLRVTAGGNTFRVGIINAEIEHL